LAKHLYQQLHAWLREKNERERGDVNNYFFRLHLSLLKKGVFSTKKKQPTTAYEFVGETVLNKPLILYHRNYLLIGTLLMQII
jgi:hypothetical protein